MLHFEELSYENFEMYQHLSKSYANLDALKKFYSHLCLICDKSLKTELFLNARTYKCQITNISEKRIILVCNRCYLNLSREMMLINNTVEQKIMSIIEKAYCKKYLAKVKSIRYRELKIVTKEEYEKQNV